LTGVGAISVRYASTSDAAVVHLMLGRLARTTGGRLKIRSTVADIEKAMSGDRPSIHVLIAEKENKAVGLAIFFLIFSTWRGTQSVYVQDIYVDPDARELGLGTRLLGGVAKWSAERGAKQMRLSVDKHNVSAQAFYERLGMVYRDDEMIYEITRNAFASLAAKA